MTTIIALVKPVPLEVPRPSKEGLVTEGIAWGLPDSERAVVACAVAAAGVLKADLQAIALGPEPSEAGLREALALGAQRAVRIAPGPQGTDALGTAKALAHAIQRLPKPWLVVAGEASTDAHQGITAAMVAELLGADLLNGVTRVEAGPQGLVASVAHGPGIQRWGVRAPAMLVVAARGASPAHPTSWGVGQAYERTIETVAIEDLGVPPAAPLVQRTGQRRSEARRSEAEVHEGDPEEAAGQLVRRLRAGGWVA